MNSAANRPARRGPALQPGALQLRLLLAGLLLIGGWLWFGNLDTRHLIRPDEGRYAEIAREMLVTGDWLTPRLNGYKYFEKPALQYWATALSFQWFGVDEWTARLWPALTGFLALLAAAGMARSMAGQASQRTGSAVLAALVLGSSLLYAFTGHVLSLDMGVAVFMSLAVFALTLGQMDGRSPATRRNWMLAGWACMALAVLSKGLIGIVLPVAGVGCYILIQRDWRLLRRLELLRGGALFLLIATPWLIAVSLANDEFFRFFFIHEHFERFLTKVHGRYQPMWYFLPILLGGLLPWTLSALAASISAWQRDENKQFKPARMLLLWCVLVFVFFSVSGSKLPSYILPLFPALAVLTGLYLVSAARWMHALQALSAMIAGVALAVGSTQLPRVADAELPMEMLAEYAPWLLTAGLCGVLGSAVSLWMVQRRWLLRAASLLGLSSLAMTQISLSGHEVLSPLYSAYHMAERVRPMLSAKTPFYSVNTFDHSLPFYLGRTVTMVSYKDELSQPIAWQPGDFIPDLKSFANIWNQQREAYAVYAANDYDNPATHPTMPHRLIMRDPRRVLIGTVNAAQEPSAR